MSMYGEPDLAELLPAYYCMSRGMQPNRGICKGIFTHLCAMIIAIGLCGSGYYYYQFMYIPSINENFSLKEDSKISPSNEVKNTYHQNTYHQKTPEPTATQKITSKQQLAASCSKEINHLRDEIAEIHNWRAAINTLMTKMQWDQDLKIQTTITDALTEFEADGIGLMDYAASYAGGTIAEISRETRPHPTHRPLSIFKIINVDVFSSPEEIIRPCVMPGSCFAFRGRRGAILVRLGKPINVGGITLSHGSRMLLGADGMSSAPQHFEVHGFTNDVDYEGTFLGKFTYDWMGRQHQTFEVTTNLSKNRIFELVELSILSNYGKEEFTCLYRFRVHKRDDDIASDKASQTVGSGSTTKKKKKCC